MATIIFFRNTWLCKESFLLIIFTPKVHLFWPERTRITDGDPQPHAPDFYRCHHPDNPDRSLPSQIWKTMLNPSILPIKCYHTIELQIFNDLQHDFILCCSPFSILFYSFSGLTKWQLISLPQFLHELRLPKSCEGKGTRINLCIYIYILSI